MIAVACATWCYGGVCQSGEKRRSGYLYTSSSGAGLYFVKDKNILKSELGTIIQCYNIAFIVLKSDLKIFVSFMK